MSDFDFTIPGQPAQAPTPAQPAEDQPRQMTRPGRSWGGSVSIDAETGETTFQDHRAGTPGSVYVPSTEAGPSTPVTSPLSFMKDGTNQRILAREASMHDLVDLGGRIGVTTVGSALHNEWLRELPGGGFARAGEASPAAAPEGVDKADTKSDDKPTPPPAPERSYLPHASEAHLRDLEAQLGEQTFANVETFLIEAEDGQSFPDTLLATVGQRLGVDRDGARQAVARAAGEYRSQAAQAVDSLLGPVSAEVFAWARSNKAGTKALKEAARAQVQDRDLSGYSRLASPWLIDKAKTDPQAVAEGLRAGGTKARVYQGEVIVDLGKAGGGETSLAAAIRGDVISLSGKRRSKR